MYLYKHYSFDLWLTIIKSNPLFKKRRCYFFYEHFNTLSKPIEEVEYIFRQVDVMCNSINERTGKNIDADEMYLMVISLINENNLPLDEIDSDELYNKMEALLFEHLPVLYCDGTKDVLRQLKDHSDITLNILSNTGFIRGRTLRQVLSILDIDTCFDFQLYSDETGCSKPNPAFFNAMLQELAKLRSISLADIVHIGDNPRADIAGATATGIQSMLVNSNNVSITQLTSNVARTLLTT